MKNKYLSHEQRYQIDMLLQRKTQQKTQLILIKTSASTFNKKLGVISRNTVIYLHGAGVKIFLSLLQIQKMIVSLQGIWKNANWCGSSAG